MAILNTIALRGLWPARAGRFRRLAVPLLVPFPRCGARPLVALWLSLICGGISGAAEGRSPAHELEYEVKAACLFNFCKYVEWPAAAFPTSDAPVYIGVLGNDPFGSLLEQTIAGRTVQSRKVQVLRSQHAGELRQCQVLFISTSERDRLAAVHEALKDSRALTVGEMPRFLNYGMIQFVIENNVVRFDINLEEADRAGLVISARLLKLARRVVADRARPEK